MRVYLDNCALNRPFDDQVQERIRRESESVLELRKLIELGRIELVWSYVIDYENYRNPFNDRRNGVEGWKGLASLEIAPSPDIDSGSLDLLALGLGDADSLHLTCAIKANADYFVTTDDAIIKRSEGFPGPLIVSNPIDLMEVVKKT